MRIATIVLPTLLSLGISLQAHALTKVNFYSGTFHELRKEAFEEDKPYILYFSFAGEEASRELESYTFLEPSLASYISQNYLIYKITAGNANRGDDFLDKDFKVHESSLIIFDAKSYEVERIKGFVDPEFLLSSLRKYQPERGDYPVITKKNKKKISEQSPIIEDLGPNTAVRKIPNEFFSTDDEYLQDPQENNGNENAQNVNTLIIVDQHGTDPEDKGKRQKTQEANRWKRENPFHETHQSQANTDDREILSKRFDFEDENAKVDYTSPYTRIPSPAKQYEESVSELRVVEKSWRPAKEKSYDTYDTYEPTNTVKNPSQKRGFGIQTGVFEQAFFMRQELEFLKSKFNRDVFVKKSSLNGKEVYKVQIGPFPSEAAARAFEKTFRKVSGNRKGMLVYIQ